MSLTRVFLRQDGAIYKAFSAKGENDSELPSVSSELLAILPNSGKPRTPDFIASSLELIKQGLLAPSWFQEQEDNKDVKV